MGVGLLLLKNPGRQGNLKFVITLIATTIGTMLLLLAATLSHAVSSSMERMSWRNAVAVTGTNTEPGRNLEALTAPNAVLSVQPQPGVMPFLDKNITRFAMHFTGGNLPPYSPLATYPRAGEYYVSPALDKLLNSYPAATLRDRFDGKQVGIIPQRALASPDELIIISGLDEAQFARSESNEAMNAVRVTDFSQSAYGPSAQRANKIVLTGAIAIGLVAMMLPILLLMSTATKLGARERETRYAALRLVGATKWQVQRFTFVDSLTASLAGIALGAGSYWLLKPLLAEGKVAGLRFFPQDVTISVAAFAGVMALTIIIVWLAAVWALRDAVESPLGVVRLQKTARTPRFRSALLLIACLGLYIYFGTISEQQATQNFGDLFPLYFVGLFFMTIIGLLLAGGWLIKLYGALLARLDRHAIGMLVARRIGYNARTIFRGISGIVVAFYGAAFFIGTLTAISSMNDTFTALIDKITPDHSIVYDGLQDAAANKELEDSLKKTGGYNMNPIVVFSAVDNSGSSIVSCKDIQRLLRRSCETSAEYVAIPFRGSAGDLKLDQSASPPKAAPNTPQNYIVSRIYMPIDTTSGSALKAEQVVTGAQLKPEAGIVRIANATYRSAYLNANLQRAKSLLYYGVALIVVIGSLNLVVATVAGLFDRRESFRSLRLGGAELSFLRKVVIRESMLPLVFIALVSLGLGFASAYIFLRLVATTLSRSYALPEPSFWVCVALVFVLSHVGIRLILPMLNKLTAIETNRTE